jgi:hypothetical protein
MWDAMSAHAQLDIVEFTLIVAKDITLHCTHTLAQ